MSCRQASRDILHIGIADAGQKLPVRLISAPSLGNRQPYCRPNRMAEIAFLGAPTHPKAMVFSVLRTAAAVMSAATIAALATVALAQSPEGDAKPADANAAEAKIDDIAEAARLMTGPAANPECVWHGTRVVRLLVGEDIDTALRQLEFYDRFKCPAEHIQASFRCFLRQGPMDPKAAESVKTRVRECWINPSSSSASPPATAATSAPPTHPGTTSR
jgi:hypothetical protein